MDRLADLLKATQIFITPQSTHELNAIPSHNISQFSCSAQNISNQLNENNIIINKIASL